MRVATRGTDKGDRRRLGTFDPAFRREIHSLMHTSPVIADLAHSFPGLLFALATGFGTPEKRRDCLSAILEGAPLRQAAALLSVPWWLRRLPPEAFTHRIIDLPAGSEFSRRIVDLIPEEPANIGPWLWAIEHGYRGCHWRFALWAARALSKDNRFLLRSDGEIQFRLLTAWAWHAEEPATPGHRLLNKPWTPPMGLRRALDELAVWRRRTALAVALNARGRDTWLSDGSANGYQFFALQTPEDFIRESQTMENCLDQYADHFDSGFSSIFSVKRKGRSVATLEVGGHEGEASMPAIRQLRGRRNRKAHPEVWRAAYAWLGSQPLRPRTPRRVTRSGINQALAELWNPYLQFLEAAGLANEFAASVIGLKVGPIMRMPRPPRKAASAACSPASNPKGKPETH